MDKLEAQERNDEFPNIQVFLSIMDATISVSAVKNHLLDRVKNVNNEVVLFDINRNNNVIPFLKHDPIERITALMNHPDLGFSISLISNESTDSLGLLETKNWIWHGLLMFIPCLMLLCHFLLATHCMAQSLMMKVCI
jgi:hypothetical protein